MADATDPMETPAQAIKPPEPASSVIRLWSWLLRMVPGLLIAAVLVLIILVVRPQEPADAGATNMAAAWSDSIRKLGIEPLFPPQEDFSVGDVWAVIAAYDQSPGQTREVNPRESIVGKGVRIGRIKLKNLGYEGVVRPVFPLTKVKDEKINFEETTRLATLNPTISREAVESSFVSFPSLSIVRHTNDAGTIASLIGLGAARDTNSTEIVKIPIAETYSVPAANAAVALGAWCAAAENLGMCDDSTIRRIIAYSLLNKVFDTLDGKYRYRFDLKLVTQTYMTRQIDFQRLGDAKLDRHVKSDAKTDGTDPKPETTGFVSDQTDAFGFGIEKVIYPRPVVFGFHAVSTSLEPSSPVAPPPAGDVVAPVQ